MNTSSNEIKDLLTEIESCSYKDLTKQQLFSWGSKLLRASLALSEQCLEAEQDFNQSIVASIEDGKSVSESTTRAKASVIYGIKQRCELYVTTTKEAMRFLEQFNRSSDCECQKHS